MLRTAGLAALTATLAACATPAVRNAEQTPQARPDASAWTMERLAPAPIRHPDGESASWWYQTGAAEAASRGAMNGQAKNLILFVGDGMSLTTVAAARIYAGQQLGQPGEEHRLSWEHFPATALSRTYNTDYQTPDSAGTMSAMATGAKTRFGMISVGQSMAPADCTGIEEGHLMTLWELAADAGLRTGIVTTARLSHATPAATLAHAPARRWESDADLPEGAAEAGCTDIALQMIDNPHGQGAQIMMGGGRANFLPETMADPEYPEETGKRKDGLNLMARWRQRHPNGVAVWNSGQLADAPLDAPLLALFEPSHMRYEDERAEDPGGEPSLVEMTRMAIERLQGSPGGFLLLVEGGRIDHAHHAGWAARALNETVVMAEAVQTALDMTSADDTLILVTADHSHTLSFVGYPVRGNPILGSVAHRDSDGQPKTTLDKEDLPYTTLAYANGPGAIGSEPRPDISDVDTSAWTYRQQALVPLGSESHGGEDVGVWASGPGSDAVRGNIEQNTIFHLLLQAHPRLRESLCQRGDCNPDGVPNRLPRPTP